MAVYECALFYAKGCIKTMKQIEKILKRIKYKYEHY